MFQKTTNIISEEGFNINIEELNKRFKQICIFDSNLESNNKKHLTSSKIIALGSTKELTITDSKNALQQLQKFCNTSKSWIFGYLTYDLKNEIEELSSKNDDGLQFPLLHFFSPEIVIQIINNSATLFYDDEFVSASEATKIYELSLISSSTFSKEELKNSSQIVIQPKISKEEYINAVNHLKQHIRKGDIYEVNFCQEFFAKNAKIDPVSIYKKLNVISEAPFSSFSKFDSHFLMCASPERFLQKQGNKLISQPIKGTAKRSENILEDERLKNDLQNNLKERSENVMIVDLVRNDLSHIAKRGTVKVEELHSLYSFKQVHQLISTVSCELKENISFTDILKSTFPMGSMTGAPKISAMKLIEEFESTKRGLYSGAVGYISPDGDFDFNVVIRSILYNADNNYLSFMVGSAITDKANAGQEYEECLLKAKAMFEVLSTNY
ncbi:MAG: anthranilate synthase component I family protein [Bacteroidia bacterium]